MSTEYRVESELYREKIFENVSTLQNSNSLMKITFTYLPQNNRQKDYDISLDEDGDLLVSRNQKIEIELEYASSTTIPLVGFQLWRGALVLADYILFTGMSTFLDKTVLELGAGVGLTSIVASLFAKEVIATDVPAGGILKLIERNFGRNSDLMKSKRSVASLNFYDQDWPEELNEKITEADIFLAADVIYDNELTEAFLSTLEKMLSSPKKKMVLITLEKRFVFTLADLESVAPCYEYFTDLLKKNWNKPPMSTWTVQLLDLDFPQYFNYDRTNHLVLWQMVNQ